MENASEVSQEERSQEVLGLPSVRPLVAVWVRPSGPGSLRKHRTPGARLLLRNLMLSQNRIKLTTDPGIYPVCLNQ